MHQMRLPPRSTVFGPCPLRFRAGVGWAGSTASALASAVASAVGVAVALALPGCRESATPVVVTAKPQEGGSTPTAPPTSPPDRTAQPVDGAATADPRIAIYAAFPRALKGDPIDERLPIVRRMLSGQRYDQAEVAARAVLQSHPRSAEAQFLLALAIHKQKRYAEARTHFEKAIALRQGFTQSDHLFHFLGWCLYYDGDLPGARIAFEEHLRRVPTEADTIFGLGVVAMEEDRIDDAERLFRRAIELQTGDPRLARDVAKAKVRLADIHVRRDTFDDAVVELEAAVALWPDHYEAWLKLARVYARLGREADAENARAKSDEAMKRVGRAGPAPVEAGESGAPSESGAADENDAPPPAEAPPNASGSSDAPSVDSTEEQIP